MEFIPETFSRAIRNHTKANKLVPILSTKLYMYQLARSVAYIHQQGVCHRYSNQAGAGASAMIERVLRRPLSRSLCSPTHVSPNFCSSLSFHPFTFTEISSRR
jgi:serine/threonine protein kinase